MRRMVVMAMKHIRMVLTFAILFLLCLQTSSVSAHAGLVGTSPKNGEIVKDAPTKITLRFTETLEPGLVSIRLYDWNANEISIEKPKLQRGDASTVYADLPTLAQGSYTVVWSVVSEDGHPVKDTLLFSVGVKSASVKAPNENPNAKYAASLNSLFLIITRYVTQGMILLMGGLVFVSWRATKHSLPSFREILGKNMIYSWLLPLLGMLMLWLLYEATLPEVNLTKALLNGDWGLLGQSPFAVMILVSTLLLLLTAIPRMETGWYITMWLLVVTVQALGGHVWGIEPLALSIIARVMHVLTVSLWLGALFYQVLISVQGKRENAPFKAFFLRLVAVAAFCTLASGAVLLMIQSDFSSVIGSTGTWSCLLLGKLFAVAAMLFLAWRQTRSWRGGESLKQTLLRVETILGLIALLAGVWMSQTQYPLPAAAHDHQHVEYKQGESK